jgi:hypothetical protein
MWPFSHSGLYSFLPDRTNRLPELTKGEETREGFMRGQSWIDDYDPRALAALVLLVGILALLNI